MNECCMTMLFLFSHPSPPLRPLLLKENVPPTGESCVYSLCNNMYSTVYIIIAELQQHLLTSWKCYRENVNVFH